MGSKVDSNESKSLTGFNLFVMYFCESGSDVGSGMCSGFSESGIGEHYLFPVHRVVLQWHSKREGGGGRRERG